MRFQQRYTVKVTGVTKTSGGSVSVIRPGKLSWRYTSNQNRVVANGKLVKIYEAHNHRMYEQEVTRIRYPAPVSFLIGSEGWQSAFDFTVRDAFQERSGAFYVLLATPRHPPHRHEATYFYVDARTFFIRRVVTDYAQGNRSTIDFENPQFHPALPPDEFELSPPLGTDVYRGTGVRRVD